MGISGRREMLDELVLFSTLITGEINHVQGWKIETNVSREYVPQSRAGYILGC